MGGEIARTLGLRVPEIVFANLDPILSRTEGDEEIQDLIKFSGGLNIGLHYLTGALSYDPLVTSLDSTLASQIVWLDLLIMNVDRTPRNTNMLVWHKELWLIDHGASFYLHHADPDIAKKGEKAFPLVKDHVLLPLASELEAVDKIYRSILTAEKIEGIVSIIPDQWLSENSSGMSAYEIKEAYSRFLESRVASSEILVKEAQHARERII
ncbi:hypothetical protein BH23BAC1_BH23BAC1_22810 [soil metagenome]